ncbi:MAG: ribonuclease J [Actinobacteria bacterium]|nr:ribonuclease J [Actinomycetota bacterium]MCL6104319.1 ribonuclease J [Actinomycetota bacterium]
MRKSQNKPINQPLDIAFLGGLGEIGRNCAYIKAKNHVLIIDCGIQFPDPGALKSDLILPNFSYLLQNASLIEGVVLTHGHEDHIGGLSLLLKELKRVLPEQKPLKVWGSRFTLELTRLHLEETRTLKSVELVPVEDLERVKVGPFEVEFIPMTHSVPHGFGLAIHTPQGVIIHSGDFKIDLDPIDKRFCELGRIGTIATQETIRLLLSDSTNADEHGHTESESEVGSSLKSIIERSKGRRVIVVCFASHIHRIAQAAQAAIEDGRMLAVAGRSMEKNISIAIKLGLLQIPEDMFLDIEDTQKADPTKVCVLCTGSQGEPMSALSMMTRGDHKWLKVGPNDVVVMSSHPIPGNEWAVGKVIDGLCRKGCEVVHSGVAFVHTTGHAKADELATLLNITRPENFIPIHGEFRHLTAHIKIAERFGTNTLLAQDGDLIVLDKQGVKIKDKFPAGYEYV